MLHRAIKGALERYSPMARKTSFYAATQNDGKIPDFKIPSFLSKYKLLATQKGGKGTIKYNECIPTAKRRFTLLYLKKKKR